VPPVGLRRLLTRNLFAFTGRSGRERHASPVRAAFITRTNTSRLFAFRTAPLPTSWISTTRTTADSWYHQMTPCDSRLSYGVAKAFASTIFFPLPRAACHAIQCSNFQPSTVRCGDCRPRTLLSPCRRPADISPIRIH
jgi:hypothetical protein